jgi:hypothetical protein
MAGAVVDAPVCAVPRANLRIHDQQYQQEHPDHTGYPQNAQHDILARQYILGASFILSHCA